MWRGARAVEGARLESVCTVLPYRGFESLSLRHFTYVDFQRNENPRGSIKHQERRFRLFAARKGRAKDGEDQSLSLRSILNDFVEMSYAFNRSCALQLLSIELANIVFFH